MSDDLRVSFELGATIDIGDHNFVKPTITIQNLDPTKDHAEQIQLCLSASVAAFGAMDEELEAAVMNVVSAQSQKKGYAERVKVIEGDQKVLNGNLKLIHGKVGQILGKLKEMGHEIPPEVS